MNPVATLDEPQPPTRQESPQLQQARAKLAQLELLLKQGRTILQDLRTQVDDVKKERDELRGQYDELRAQFDGAVGERDDISGKRDAMSSLVIELRADRDRIADELQSTELRRASLEEKLGATAGDVEQLRADAEHALALAREIIGIYEPIHPSASSTTDI